MQSKKIIPVIVTVSALAIVFGILINEELVTDEEITIQTIAIINKTAIDQEIVYPTDPALITSKIITIPIGAETGEHIHEIPMFGYMMEGQITVDYGDMGLKTFVKGDTLVEAINYTHNGQNTGNTPAKILVVILDENK